MTLSSKTLGLLGLVRLGKRMNEYAKVFGIEVIAWGQNFTDEAAAPQGLGAAMTRREASRIATDRIVLL